MPKAKQHLTVDGRAVPVSNLEKVLFPQGPVTKAQIIDYYVQISDYLLPHLQNRPVTLKRYPNGVQGAFFYEKDAPRFTPEWVKTFPVRAIRFGMPREGFGIEGPSSLHTVEYECDLRRRSTFRQGHRRPARGATSEADRGRNGKIPSSQEGIHRLESKLRFQKHGRRLFFACPEKAAVCVGPDPLG